MLSEIVCLHLMLHGVRGRWIPGTIVPIALVCIKIHIGLCTGIGKRVS